MRLLGMANFGVQWKGVFDVSQGTLELVYAGCMLTQGNIFRRRGAAEEDQDPDDTACECRFLIDAGGVTLSVGAVLL